MRPMSDTIARLTAAAQAQPSAFGVKTSRLSPLPGFGSNPGNLNALRYVPDALAKSAPLIVVLHGCTQTAEGYDQGSGWSTLADRHGFALLYPEQQRINNANLCFNWFVPEDIRRDGGEALSIRQMVAQMIAAHDLDPARVFITGLSAGGAMANVMLATYPELFAGGAIVAGLPYGTAGSVSQALDRMRDHGGPPHEDLADVARLASPHSGAWPTLSIWQGTADHTVSPANVEAILAQWAPLHGVSAVPTRSETIGNIQRRVWVDAKGRDRIEAYLIPGMGHGTPIDPTDCGAAMSFMLPAGISSSSRIAQFWGIASRIEKRAAAAVPRARTAPATPTPRPAKPSPVTGVAKVIEDALRAAGLMR